MSARTVAFDTIRAVVESDAYANLTLPASISRARLSVADAALATELAYGTLRMQGSYDAVIALAAQRAPGGIDPVVLDALRLGVHQLLSTRVAAHAAVNETVALVHAYGARRASGFVNAVLRRVSRESSEYWFARIAESARSDDERLGLVTSHPVWVLRALRRALAAENAADELEELLVADNAAPAVTMAALPGLGKVLPEAERTEYSPVGFRLGGGDPAGLVASSGGLVRVQDEGSQLAALALTRAGRALPGERWLDLCAGPGGKTALLAAEAAISGASLEANEISATRATLVRAAIRTIPLEVPVSEEDGRERAGNAPGQYHRILVDAPCSGLGALRRRPEARWRKSPADLPKLIALQTELLDAACTALRPGGIVAYVTCSPHLDETAGVVAEVLSARGGDLAELDARAVLNDVSGGRLALREPSTGSGRAQLWPHRHATDAMSIHLLQRQ